MNGISNMDVGKLFSETDGRRSSYLNKRNSKTIVRGVIHTMYGIVLLGRWEQERSWIGFE